MQIVDDCSIVSQWKGDELKSVRVRTFVNVDVTDQGIQKDVEASSGINTGQVYDSFKLKGGNLESSVSTLAIQVSQGLVL